MKNSSVQNIFTNNLSNQGLIKGFVKSYKNGIVDLPDFPQIEAGSMDVILSGNQSLAPGKYGLVTINRNSSIRFGTGIYDFSKLIINKGSVLTYESDVQINIADSFAIDKNVVIRKANIDENALKVYYQSTHPLSIGMGNNINAGIYAKNTNISIKKHCNFKGSLIAENIFIDKNTNLENETVCWQLIDGAQPTSKIKNAGNYIDYIYDISTQQPSTVEGEILFNVTPNPINESSTLNVKIQEKSKAVIELFDITGNKISTIFEGEISGNILKQFVFNKNTMGIGVYYLSIKTSKLNRTIKLISL